MKEKDFENYIDVGPLKFGDIVMAKGEYYKIVALASTGNSLTLLLEKSEKSSNSPEIDRDFIKINNVVYEFIGFSRPAGNMNQLQMKFVKIAEGPKESELESI